MSEKKAAKRIDDVARPGETAPSNNSKSVIIPSRPILKAPSMASPDEQAGSADGAETPHAPSLQKTSAQKIKPLEGSDSAAAIVNVKVNPKPQTSQEPVTAPALAASTPEPAVPDPPATPPEPPKSDPSPAPESAKPEESPASPSPTQDHGLVGGDDSKRDPTLPTVESTDAEAEAQAKHDEAIQKLIVAKKYFLPINAVEKRRTKHFIILGIALSLLLGVAWADIALDAGLVQISGVKPVTHFFSN